MNLREDSGVTLTELLVAVALLMIVLSMTYMSIETISNSNRVTERQAQFAEEVTTPLHIMDKSLSQNKQLLNGGAYVSDDFTLTSRGPLQPGTNQFRRYVYTAGADGSLTERIYDESLGSATSTLARTNVWSTHNANRLKGPMFTYIGPSGETTIPAGATSVLVRIWTTNEGKYFSGERQIFFRNR